MTNKQIYDALGVKVHCATIEEKRAGLYHGENVKDYVLELPNGEELWTSGKVHDVVDMVGFIFRQNLKDSKKKTE